MLLVFLMIFVIWWTGFKGDRNARARIVDIGGRRRYSIMDMIEATKFFNPQSKVGEGRFGTVFKAELPHRNPVVAVKKLSNLSQQRKQQFDSEVDTLKKLNHANIVRLFAGYFNPTSKLQLLVYEYMEHMSLSNVLSDPTLEDKLNWGRWYNICQGIIKGLEYLHSYPGLKIIHRNITSSNILLDERWEPKISDVRLTNLCENIDFARNSYWPQEYYDSGRITENSDVFGFGLILLEIVRGKSVLEYENLASDMLDELFKLQGSGMLSRFVGSQQLCAPGFHMDEAREVLKLAIMCVEISPQRRPSIKQAMEVLNHEITTEQLSKDTMTQSLALFYHGIATKQLSEEIMKSIEEDPNVRVRIIGIESRHYSIIDVIEATKYFSKETQVGKGRFHSVYKAELPDPGPVVAVKRRVRGAIKRKQHFDSEVNSLKKVNHANIVRLFAGYSSPRSEVQLLVYEYMVHSSLSHALSDLTLKDRLSWARRYNICLGIAMGLHHLHSYREFQIVIQGMTSENILLDERWEPKISNKLDDDDRIAETLISVTYMRGGYVDEVEAGKIVDAVGFGVVLLEIVSGNCVPKTSDAISGLLDTAFQLQAEGRLLDLVDPELRDCNRREAYTVLRLALMCVEYKALYRSNMEHAVNVLKGQITIEQLSEVIEKDILGFEVACRVCPSTSHSSEPCFQG